MLKGMFTVLLISNTYKQAKDFVIKSFIREL